MKKIIKTVLIILLLALLGFTIFLSIEIEKSTTELVSQEATRKNSQMFLEEISFNQDEFLKTYTYEKLRIENKEEDYSFYVDAFNLDQSDQVFILIHGMGTDAKSMYPFGQVFLDRGYGILTYDQANSGNHPLKKNTMGHKESEDLVSLLSFMKESYPGKDLNIFAESYGAHSVLMGYDQIKDQINMIIFDSPMANGEYYLDQGFKEASDQTGLPFAFLKSLGSVSSFLMDGYSYKDINALDKIYTIKNPLLIISNKDDELISHDDALDIYSKTRGSKTLVYSESAHTRMFFDERDLYLKKLDKFLGENKK